MKHLSFSALTALLLLCFVCSIAYATPGSNRAPKKSKSLLHKGTEYAVNDQKRTPLFYSKSYSKLATNVFVTTYLVYDTSKKKTLYTVVAVHNKNKKTVEVSVKDMRQRGTPIINIERTGYSTPFMGRFGSIGKVGVIGNSKTRTTAPSQLSVKFASKKYDYIKVLEISGNRESSKQDLFVYILEQ
jgi:hypothetical protein